MFAHLVSYQGVPAKEAICFYALLAVSCKQTFWALVAYVTL